MRVLATTDTIGGVFTYAAELASALAPHGVETVIAAMGDPLSGSQRRTLQNIPGLVICEAPFRLEWMDDPWEDVERAASWLLSLARKHLPDVVHLNEYSHAVLDFEVPKVVVAHSCVLSWWRALKGREAPPEYDRYRDAVAAGLAAADHVIAPTAAFLAEIAAIYGPMREARVVSNGIRHRERQPRPRDRSVLGAGRLWDEAKNLAILDEVAELIDWPVHLAGSPSGPHGTPFSARNARLLGVLSAEALTKRMERASILCHPARYEPFGLVPLEAASAGCALVLGDLPTLREIWGDTALYAPPTDARAVAAQVSRLAADEGLRAELGEAAETRARRFDTATQAREMLAIYAGVTGTRTADLARAS